MVQIDAPSGNVFEPIFIEEKKEETIEDIVKSATERYGVSFNEVWAMIGCETKGTYDPTIQAEAILWYGREESYGLAQIHLPSHPYVTYASATDPYFSADFIAKNWTNHRDWWKCKPR